MFGFFINQLNTDGKKLYQKVLDLYKKRIRLERSKTYFDELIAYLNSDNLIKHLFPDNLKKTFIS